jgi:hypothetical protein
MAAPLGVFTSLVPATSAQYRVSLVGIDGKVWASYTAAVGDDEIPPPLTFGRCCAVDLPTISLSDTRVYFLDGISQLRVMSSDGTTPVVHTLPNVRGKTRAVFSVSPDDKRIAISLFDWSVSPMSLTVYVEDLIGGGNRAQIFSSTSVYEWPVAWHNGNLVLAADPVPNASNPYGAGEYHVASPSDGTRLSVMGGRDCPVVGPLSQAGTACASNCDAITTCIEAVDWSGNRSVLYRRPNTMGSGASWSALSPDGTAVTTGTTARGGDGVATRAGLTPFTGNVVSLANWWIDKDHLLAWLCSGPSLGNCDDVIGVIDPATGAAFPESLFPYSPATDDPHPVGWFPATTGG